MERMISSDQIAEKALEIAREQGVDNLSIRKLASGCDIAIGSVYNYFSNKAALINAVSKQFWAEIIKDQEELYFNKMNFTLLIDRYYRFLYGRLAPFDNSWLENIDKETNEHIIAFLRYALDNDERVNNSIWNIELNKDTFGQYVFDNMLSMLRNNKNDCRFLITLLERLLY